MANGEDVKSTSARLLSTAALSAGVGTALYKGFKESPGVFSRAAEAVRGGTSYELPRMMVTTPVEDQARALSEAFSAAEDIMDKPGTTEVLRRSYERALYSAGMVADKDRTRLVTELVESSGTWSQAENIIRKYEHQLGGFEGLYRSMREIARGTVVGNRGKELSQLIRELPNVGPDEFGKQQAYLRSDFSPDGNFWKHHFGLRAPEMKEIPTAPIPSSLATAKSRRLSAEIGLPATLGIRESNRPRLFQKGQEGLFEFSIEKGKKLTLPFSEFRIGESSSKWFLQAPTAVQHKGANFVAADHRGMSYASVPHFAIPTPGKGPGYKKVSWNEGLRVMLYGDEKAGIEGLAQRLHKLHGDEKAMRDLTWEWNTKIGGLFHRITGPQGNMTQAMMHSKSIIPADRLIAQIGGEEVDTSVEALTKFYGQMQELGAKEGWKAGPLASADPMAKTFRVSTVDWGERWDVFGQDYAMERKYASRVRPFTLTSESAEAMAKTPIGGVLPRGYGITATAAARAEMEALPQAAAYLTLGKARHFGEEESVISSKLSDMMKMKSVQKFEVLADTTQTTGRGILKEGEVIGVDYRTGKTILARGASGMVEQRIIDARTVGNVVKLEVETMLPLQDQMKIFGFKSQVHLARQGIHQELVGEWGAGKAALRFSNNLEFIGHADLMKKIPQEVNKQMAEASWLVMQKRLQEAGVLTKRSKLGRQRIRKRRGQKTYTYKGGLPKSYVNMDMYMYVRDQAYRDKILLKRQKSGVRLAKRLGLTGEQEAMGAGLEILKYAKRNLGASGDLAKYHDEMGLIGGAFYKQLEGSVGADQAARLLKEVGLTEGDVASLKRAKGVLAMPTMHVGGYASFSDKWGRAGMDYRALMELKAQRWGDAGELLVGEIARRVVPGQDLIEIEKAAISMIGRGSELPEGTERITRIRDAREAIGTKGFVFDYGGKEVYVPGPEARGMAQFSPEIGEVRSQELRASYERYFRAQEYARDYPGEKADVRVAGAYDDLMRKVNKGWAASTSGSGKVVGTAGPVARRWVPSDPSQTLARQFGSLDEFVGAKDQVFTVGITRETGTKMFRDLASHASGEEKAFLEAQRKAFLGGEKVTGFVWRHPTHRPQSLMPTWFEMTKGRGESARFHAVTLKHGDRVLDISQAQGMKLDYDFDHVQMGLIADEKVKVAQDNLLNSRRYREQFVEGLTIQQDLMKRVKDAAASGIVSKNAESYVSGLQRLVGVKTETGIISNLVGDMRAAAAFQASGKEFKIASFLLAELEEGPISSKHGLNVGEVSSQLQDFVRGEGSGIRSAMHDAWQKLLDEGDFTAGGIKYSRDEFVDKMRQWISTSEESGDLAAFRNIARRGAQAQKGKEWAKLTEEQFARAVKAFQGGRGDLNATLLREMRMGTGSAISTSRAVVDSMSRVAGVAGKSFKKHWKYPAIGAAIATGISLAFGGGEVDMPDHGMQATQLGQGPGVSHIAPPTMNPNRIVTAGGGAMPAGYGMHSSGDYSSSGFRQLGAYGASTGSSVRIRDDRGAITPEYIEKISRERYY